LWAKDQNCTDLILSTLLHEIWRVYQDRLLYEEDQIKFKNILVILRFLMNRIFRFILEAEENNPEQKGNKDVNNIENLLIVKMSKKN